MNVLIAMDSPAEGSRVANAIRLADPKATVFLLESVGVVQPLTDGDSTPKWNQIFPVGKRYRPDFPKGSITFDDDFFNTMLGNWQRFKAAGGVKLPIDYAHDEEGIASGWITDLELRDDGLYALIDWTPRARAAIGAQELQFLSPSFDLNGWDSTIGKRVGPMLQGAALLNTPFLFDLPSVAATREPNPTHHPDPEGPPQKGNTMLKKLLLALGLPEDTTEEAALEKAKAMHVALSRQLSDVEAHVELSTKPLRVELAAAKGEVTKLTAEVNKLQAEKFDGAATALCDELVKSKKILPASRDSVVEYAKALGLEKAKTFFSALPGTVVPSGEQGVRGTETELDPKESAAEWQVKLSELEAKGIKPAEAFRLAQKQNPDLFKAAMKARTNKSADA